LIFTIVPFLLIALSGVAFLILCGIVYQKLGLRSDLRSFPAPGRLIELGNRRVHLYEIGSGSPAVILESGISASSLNWRAVQSELGKITRVLSYDRAGLGWSDLCDSPCTPSALAKQLREILATAGIQAPYILVGHSFGALIVQSFAAMYPNGTAGLVLVDPLDPAEWSPLTEEQQRIISRGIQLSRRGAWAARLGVTRVFLNLLLAGNRLLPRMAAKAWSGRASEVTDRIAGQVRKMPSDTWPLVAAHWKQAKCFEGMARHFESLPQSIQEMLLAKPLSVPVILLSGRHNEHPVDPRDHAKRVSLHTWLIVAEKSGHWIQLDEPQVVVDAVRELIETVRVTESVKRVEGLT
jgi:pimeloyl-ACP methyl ester carboxylesterase